METPQEDAPQRKGRISPSSARAFATSVLTGNGLSAEDAASVADCLVAADLRGVDTHGINRLPSYMTRAREGLTDTKAQPVVTELTPVVAQVDGKNAFGAIPSKLGMAKAIEMASTFGIGMVSIKHSNHFGMGITPDLAMRIDRDDLEVDKDSVLVLKSTGPIGNPGMPESGVIPIPRKLIGVKDMLRLSDGRMSGTAGGTIVLHISPESGMVDSPFGILCDGDVIECSVAARRLHVQLTDAQIQERIVERQAVLAKEKQVVEGRRILGVKRRGYRGLYEGTVNQAEHGADFEFLTANGSLG